MMGWYYECILHFTELVDTTYKGRGELFSLHIAYDRKVGEQIGFIPCNKISNLHNVWHI